MAKGMIATPKRKQKQEAPLDPNTINTTVTCSGCGFKKTLERTLTEKVTVIEYNCHYCSNKNTITITR